MNKPEFTRMKMTCNVDWSYDLEMCKPQYDLETKLNRYKKALKDIIALTADDYDIDYEGNKVAEWSAESMIARGALGDEADAEDE